MANPGSSADPFYVAGTFTVDPAGLATEAKQDTAKTVLDAIAASVAASATGGVGHKAVTTAGTRVALAASTACRWVVITADSGNTGKIAVGPGNVVAAAGSQAGTILSAGDSVTFPVTDLATIKVDSTVDGEGVGFSYGV